MKKIITSILVLTLFSFQTEPQLTVKLSVSEWQQVIYIIDNAAVEGTIRKPLIEKIRTQAEAQLKALDSAGKKKN